MSTRCGDRFIRFVRWLQTGGSASGDNIAYSSIIRDMPCFGDAAAMRSMCSLRFAVSQLTTLRWELPEELCHCIEHGFNAISLWRPKLSDISVTEARSLLERAAVQVACLQWAGGFTGSDGRTFRESVDDCCEAIDTAEQLEADTLVVYAGCRGGHTLSHARRLVLQALQELAPIAAAAGVSLAVKPIREPAAPGCGFLATLAEAVEVIEVVDHPQVGLAIDLWAYADDPACFRDCNRLARHTRLVSIADRVGPLHADQERLPPGRGGLPLIRRLEALVRAGFYGVVEIDPVGETVVREGYEATLAAVGRYASGAASRIGQLDTLHQTVRTKTHFAETGVGSRA
jgi:sugar phosphate isomerase/epimerase